MSGHAGGTSCCEDRVQQHRRGAEVDDTTDPAPAVKVLAMLFTKVLTTPVRPTRWFTATGLILLRGSRAATSPRRRGSRHDHRGVEVADMTAPERRGLALGMAVNQGVKPRRSCRPGGEHQRDLTDELLAGAAPRRRRRTSLPRLRRSRVGCETCGTLAGGDRKGDAAACRHQNIDQAHPRSGATRDVDRVAGALDGAPRCGHRQARQALTRGRLVPSTLVCGRSGPPRDGCRWSAG